MDDLHTGDDALLDALTGIRTTLEGLRDDPDVGLSEALDSAFIELDEADALRVAELRAPQKHDLSRRAETGSMKFGDDWTGVFVRGDSAFGYAVALHQVINAGGDGIMLLQVQGLLRLLQGSDERTSPLSDTQVMQPFEEARAHPARLTDSEEGTAIGSAMPSSSSSPDRQEG